MCKIEDIIQITYPVTVLIQQVGTVYHTLNIDSRS